MADDAQGGEVGEREGDGEGGGGEGGAQAGRQRAVEGECIDEDHERQRMRDLRDAEMCKLDAERTEAMIDMMRCSSFHSVMEDWTADAGVTHGGDEDDYDDDDVIEAGEGGGFEGGGVGSSDAGARQEEPTARDNSADGSAKKS